MTGAPDRQEVLNQGVTINARIYFRFLCENSWVTKLFDPTPFF